MLPSLLRRKSPGYIRFIGSRSKDLLIFFSLYPVLLLGLSSRRSSTLQEQYFRSFQVGFLIGYLRDRETFRVSLPNVKFCLYGPGYSYRLFPNNSTSCSGSICPI